MLLGKDEGDDMRKLRVSMIGVFLQDLSALMLSLVGIAGLYVRKQFLMVSLGALSTRPAIDLLQVSIRLSETLFGLMSNCWL